MKYIWLSQEQNHTYAEFKDEFNYSGGNAVIEITADYKYAVYINGVFAALGQYADTPKHKAFSKHDITDFLSVGKNTLVVRAYHSGEGYFQCVPMTACVAYSVTADGRQIVCSSKNTLARRQTEFYAGDMLTPQIGRWYACDFTKQPCEWQPCKVVEPDFTPCVKPIKNTVICDFESASVVAQGTYLDNGGDTAAHAVQRAYLSAERFFDVTGLEKTNNQDKFPLTFKADGGNGIYILFDLKKEKAGYLNFSIECLKETQALIGWGEHLDDLRPRAFVGGRNFGFKLQLKSGVNEFSEYLRRIGGRYFILLVGAPCVKVNYFGLREEIYPFDKPEKDFGDSLLNAVYETGRRTLELCAHEHYEDCPWREQALYGMDSRNQMLFGYGAFGEYEYPRANLKMFAHSIEDDGLFPLCPPSVSGLTIPSFSAYWLWAVCENAQADYSEEFLQEMLPTVKRVFEAFVGNMQGNAVKVFEGERYWNFHEWSKGLTGGRFDDGTNPVPCGGDGILTALIYRAAVMFAPIAKRLGDGVLCDTLTVLSEKLFQGILSFYDVERNAFASYVDGLNKTGYHQLTQAVFLIAAGDRLPKNMADGARAALLNDAFENVTFAGLQLKYDALGASESTREYVINDVKERFSKMLFSGATSFWETQKGEADFDDAGSLCHGWSAVCCYVLDKFYK